MQQLILVDYAAVKALGVDDMREQCLCALLIAWPCRHGAAGCGQGCGGCRGGCATAVAQREEAQGGRVGGWQRGQRGGGPRGARGGGGARGADGAHAVRGHGRMAVGGRGLQRQLGPLGARRAAVWIGCCTGAPPHQLSCWAAVASSIQAISS